MGLGAALSENAGPTGSTRRPPDDGPLAAVARWPVDAAAAGVRRSDGTTTVVVAQAGDPTHVFAWASLTKLLVATAVLVATEEGVLSLDDPAGPEGSTLRHLLAHASGLAPDAPVALTAPGRRRIYSNAGYEVVADTLARRAAMPFAAYLAAAVLEPLGMAGTELPAGASPASGARGPLCDLLALAGELQVPRLVHRSTLAAATAVAFPGLAGVLPGYGRFDPCDWGLGVEVRGAKVPHWTGSANSAATFGHFGQAGGFVWVDPDARTACAALSDRAFGPWAVVAWPALADAVLGHLWDRTALPYTRTP